MKRRQTRVPRQWLVADERLGDDLWAVLRALPRGSGVLVLYRELPGPKRSRLVAKLRRRALGRGLVIADEAAGEAARVHDTVELRQAAAAGVPLLFLSPIYRTRSHPDRPPLPRMRSAALLRLARVPAIALGGMNAERFARVRQLGFHGWAGIDAWLVSPRRLRPRT